MPPPARLLLVFLVSLLSTSVRNVAGKTFENRIIGKPFVACRTDAISLVARTEDYFEGQIYVKGARKGTGCFREYSAEQNSTKLELKIDARQLLDCGFKAYIKPNSKKLLLSGQVIIAFHRDLVTPSDRAFRAHCEFDDFKKNADVEVENVIQKHEMIVGNFELPEVTMSVLPAGEESIAKEGSNDLKVLKVGDPIIFQWKLEKANTSIFGIQLERCSAETENGRGMKIIENGCSLDEELISDAIYSTDNSKIFANSLAFKFPEEHVVYIRCAVRTCVRRLEHLRIVDGSDEDLCSAEQECGINARNRRQLGSNNSRTDIIFVNGRFRIEKHHQFEHLRTPSYSLTPSEQFCMPDAVYYVGVSSVIVCYLATISTTVFFQWGSRRRC